MARIIVGVESDQVTVEDAVQQGLADRDDSVDLGRGKWSVQEEADLHVLLCVADQLTQHLWEEHEVIVVDPDHVIVLDVGHDRLRKELVDFVVGGPCRLVEGNLAGVVVEQGPEDLVCETALSARCSRVLGDWDGEGQGAHTGETIVMLVGQVVVDENRVCVTLFLEHVAHMANLVLGYF